MKALLVEMWTKCKLKEEVPVIHSGAGDMVVIQGEEILWGFWGK